MLMTSILLQKRERPSEAAPVFISRIPSRSHPETIPKERRRNGEGKAGEMERQDRCYRRSMISAPGHIRLLKRKVASLWFLAWKRESVMVVHRPPCRYCTLLGT